MPGDLFVGVGERDKTGFAPLPSDEREPDRQALSETGRDGDARITCDRRRRRAGAGEVVAIHQVGGPGRAAGRRDDRVEPIPVITASMPCAARRRAARLRARAGRPARQRSLLLRLG